MLEAAVAGVPTVGTAVGHIAEWSPEASLAVPVGDFMALAAAVRQLLENEDLRLRIARAAHRRAVEQDADYTGLCFEQLYSSLVTDGRRPQ
jgi:glycosyltransferase involved in cell wall biosynthesis